MMNNIPFSVLEARRERFAPGTRVELVSMDDPYNTRLKSGARGTVDYVDDIGTIHVHWDCGSSLGLVYGEDYCKVIDDEN